MRAVGLTSVMAALLSVAPSHGKGNPSETWTSAEIHNGVCFVERDYGKIRIALAEGVNDYVIILSINGKNVDVGNKYELKISFPEVYESRISGTGVDNKTIAFKDVFPTILGNFMIKNRFSIYIDGRVYGEFDLSGSSKSVQSLIDCKNGLRDNKTPSTRVSRSEWWQDTFIWEESGRECSGNDTISTYSTNEAEFWESSCSIRKITPLKEIDAVILDMKCKGLPGEGTWFRQQILMKSEDNRIASFPPLQKLKRCSSQKDTPDTSAQSECDVNSRLYRSQLYKAPDPNSYQELQFTGGAATGAVDLTEYRQGQAVWVAHGRFTCSNGASICRVNFPLTLGEQVELPYEMVGDAGSSPEMVVIPALRQEVYQTGQYATLHDKAYGGLAVDFLNGFEINEDELTLPANVYTYAGCKN